MSEVATDVASSELVLDRYRPLRPLGSGGSGSVWLARDEQSGAQVALKIVRREGKAASRAEREAEAAARLSHERCLRARALGRDEGHVYIAYDYVPGRTLREALRAGELDDADAVEAAAQILDALAHAHGRGIVHRDVKPSNVLLAEGEGISIRLLDFGLAQMAEAETLTAVGDVPGTLAYIAPERLSGKEASAASDVWAAGLLLYEALAGEHPFWRGSLLETARAIERGTPPLASRRPDLPRELVRAVDAALSLEPARRPSAGRLASLLRSARRLREPRRRQPVRPLALAPDPGRLAAAGLAALAAGWSATALPFYPGGSAFLLAAIAGAVALARERAGLAFALAVPILPCGNLSLGLALLYSLLAATWLALAWREPRSGLACVLGPVLAPLGALGLAPLASLAIRSPVRRAAQTAAAVLLSGVTAGLAHASLPFTGGAETGDLGIAGSEGPLAVAGALLNTLLAHPALALEALALAGLAAALPTARKRGRWGIAAIGAAMVAATLLLAPGASSLPLVAAAWVTCAALALRVSVVQAAGEARLGAPSRG